MMDAKAHEASQRWHVLQAMRKRGNSITRRAPQLVKIRQILRTACGLLDAET